MIEELVRGFLDQSWIEKLDFSTLERVNASFVSEDMQGREGDVIWKLRLKDGRPVFVYLLIEFQSRVERYMAVRLMTYLGLLYQDLIAHGLLAPDGRLPFVIPIVLYNGEERWWAPQELSELIDSAGLAEIYVPRLRHRVIDEGSYPAEELEEHHSAVATLFGWRKAGSVGRSGRGSVGWRSF